jgi:hypothetical protein
MVRVVKEHGERERDWRGPYAEKRYLEVQETAGRHSSRDAQHCMDELRNCADEPRGSGVVRQETTAGVAADSSLGVASPAAYCDKPDNRGRA